MLKTQLHTSAIQEVTATKVVRKGKARRVMSPKANAPSQPLKTSASKRKGRATAGLLSSAEMRGQISTGVHSKRATHARFEAGAETKLRLKPNCPVSPQPFTADVQLRAATHDQCDIGNGEDQVPFDTPLADVLANLIDEVIEQWRRRQMWHRAEKSLTLQAKSMCRRLLAGDKTEAEALYKSAMNGGAHALAATAQSAMFPLLEARKTIETHRTMVEKRLSKIGQSLPVAGWVDGIRGFGLLSLAGIIGEAGDLSKYGNPAKLWKRMGLAVMGDGDRQRMVSGEAAIDHGYNPARRSLMWTIGDCIVKIGGPYRLIYDQRKEYEIAKNERGEYADRAARMLKQKTFAKTTAAFKCYSEGKLPPAHIHNSAKRYMEKRLLRDLWRAWRDAIASMETMVQLRPSEFLREGDHHRDVHQEKLVALPTQ